MNAQWFEHHHPDLTNVASSATGTLHGHLCAMLCGHRNVTALGLFYPKIGPAPFHESEISNTSNDYSIMKYIRYTHITT